MKRALRRLLKAVLLVVLGKENKPRRVLWGNLRGFLIMIEPRRNLGDMFSTREPHLQAILKCFLNSGGIAVDIGASTGFFTLLMSHLVGPTGRVYAFEPVKATVDILRRNLELNEAANVEVKPVAVSDAVGSVVLRVPESNASMASMHWHKDEESMVCEQVNAVVLDQVEGLSEICPDFVKIDVEGAEGNVIRGALELLRRCRPILFVECSELGRDSVWQSMKELGYACFSALDHGDEIVDQRDYRHGDFLWIHTERAPT
jgi:FkbM family methyltransferase